jgi:predicted nucleic acid-binding protein
MSNSIPRRTHDLVAGDSVFLDANTLVYHFTSDPIYGLACSQLLQRIENQEILGFTSTHILTELAHRLMTIEAIGAFTWPMAGIARRLRQHPAQVQQLAGFFNAVERILQSRIQTLAIPVPLVPAGTTVSRQTGLLSNDALIVAIMQANGLSRIASEDNDFDRVPGLTRYAPV